MSLLLADDDSVTMLTEVMRSDRLRTTIMKVLLALVPSRQQSTGASCASQAFQRFQIRSRRPRVTIVLASLVSWPSFQQPCHTL